MEKTRILYLISSLTQGGAERHLVDLVRDLDPARWDPAICVLTERIHYKAELPAGQPKYTLGSRVWASPAALARLIADVRAFRPHILHTYMNDANLWGRLAGRFARSPAPRVITSVHLDDMSAGYRWIERPLARWTDRIVAHSRSIEQFLVDGLRVPAALVTVIPNGVDEDQFRPASDEERRTARRARDFTDDQLVALMAARIAPQKNHDLVVAALARLKAAGALPPSFRLLLAGRVSSASYDRQVRAAVARSGLGDQVQFLGPVANMRELYAASDVVLMPSRTEASPIAALEALACGLPVLISASANTDQVLLPGQHGWQIEEATEATIAGALSQILSSAPDRRRAQGLAAREHVLERFTQARVTRDFENLYRETNRSRA
jgi:glycosyltransferase involved in cell wall biosynthesis